jgi:hypothetical protein
MQKRDKLEAMLREMTDEDFDAVWKSTYGYVPEGERSDLARDFVAEQYDEELDGDIKLAESLLQHPAPRLKPSKWLSPR